MKPYIPVFILLALLLTACSFSLAEDITPPPNYVTPVPPPTIGPLYPEQPPSIERGAAIYAEKCVECHGRQGMGDGDKGKQLPVTVAAIGLPQVARPASPADWFIQVSQGNIERFMPPFNSLNNQQRWDVVAYAMSLHITPEQIEHGKQLFETNCLNCPTDFFKNLTEMAALSADDLVSLLKTGSDKVTALTGNLSDDDYYAVAVYLRTLTYETTLPSPTPEPVTPTTTLIAADATPATSEAAAVTPVPSADGAPSATASVGGTPLATATGPGSTPEAVTATLTGSETPVAPAGAGKVAGSVSGGDVAGLEVTLHGLDHALDQTGASGPQEVLTQTTTINEDGTYTFENVDIPEGRIFLVEVDYLGITYESEPVVAETGTSEVTVPEIRVYNTSKDYSVLSFSQVHLFLDFSDGAVQVIVVYTFSNTTENAIVVEATMEVPFIKMPAGAQNIGFDLAQDSAPILAAEGGFALKPSETPYGLVAFYSLPYNGKAKISQPFSLPSASVVVLVPEGIKVKSSLLTTGEMRNFQGTNYQEYSAANLNAGDVLELDLSGKPKTGTSSASPDSRQNLLIGVGALGAVLILVGAWMYIRDRNRSRGEVLEEETEEEDGFESQADLLDAIIALDDLHRAGKINGEVYQQRRAELKARLKDLV